MAPRRARRGQCVTDGLASGRGARLRGAAVGWRKLAAVRCVGLAVLACCGPAAAPSSAPAPAAPAPASPAPAAPAPAPAPPAATPDPSRLPEDPIAGKQSEQQWRQHMEDEERERQLAFDHNRVRAHRAVVRLFGAARARYDRARSAAAVAKVRSDMPAQIAEIRRRVTEIDHWGVNSPLLPDYEALENSLSAAYADAKLAALNGDATALAAQRAEFDQRMKKIAAWLEQAAEGEHE
jgi:hypothetical protein